MMTGYDRNDKIFVGTIVLVHAVFFALAMHYTRIYMGDSFEYIYEALNIKRYSFFYSGNPAMPIVPEYMTQRQPGYPLFLLAIYLFAVNNWIVILLQNVLSVFNICYARKMLMNIGFRKKYDWLLLLLVVAYPAQFINANTIAPDILLQTFTLVYFANFVLLIQRKQLKYAVFMSLALIAGMLVKPVFYPFAAVHLFIIIVAAARLKMKLQRPMLAAILPLCVVFAYNYWNYTRTEKFHFTSNQAFNASFYYYSFFVQKYGPDSANIFLSRERRVYDLIPEYKDRYDYANERGMQLLSQNFLPYLVFHLKNSARIFIEPGKAEIDLFTGRLTYGRLYSREQTGFYATLRNNGWGGMGGYVQQNPSILAVLVVFIFNCVRLIGLFLFFSARGINRGVRFFAFLLFAYFAVAAGPIANTRYFLPVSLLAIGCAVVGFVYKAEPNFSSE